MYENIVGSHAEELNGSNGKFIISDSINKKDISFFTYYEGDMLCSVISDKLDEAEKSLELDLKLLEELENVLSLLNESSSLKEEYDARLKSLKSLFYISNEIKTISINVEEKPEELEPILIQLDALLKVSNHGPLRNLLEKEILYLNQKLVPILKVEINYGNFVDLINLAKSAEEIDEIFCELSIEDYINLGLKRRTYVSSEFFNLTISFSNKDQIIDCLNDLITICNRDFKESKDESNLVQEEKFKNTLNENEIGILIN